jgi:hypothetical protein
MQIPEVGNLTRKKRRREERSFVVPDSVIVGDRGKNEYENSLDSRQQEVRLFFFLYGRNVMSFLFLDSRTVGLKHPQSPEP